ncbi:MAG: tripartite tricarboxylate transporter TctB family protein [Proteobacteria bacterium]|nr:tripartite tricarboxylate transporter TctB family protein [Pseudomonadota bacterium]MBU2228237.1 tripartite tricarboxylate transporter TctB family protein [Pseudomonadota bacterium]MBU2261246.1 tripartite tricarboxylate transporter TctB family protein [Pseudomonadota bacterium]
MIRNVNTDLVAGTLGLLLSLTFWSLIDPRMTHMSAVFPTAMIGIMAIASALLVIKGFSRAAERGNLFDVGSNVRVLATGLFFFGWVIAIGYLGFFVSSVLVMSLLALYLALAGRRVSPARFALWVGIVACEVAFFYLIFTRLLHVLLPEGWFF